MKRPALIVLIAPALLLTACRDESPAPQASSATESAVVRDDAYTGILGVVTSLPSPGSDRAELRIHHEHIPTFRTKEGEINVTADGVPGMKSMVMPFPVAEGLDVSSLQVGDKVRFDFTVQWGGTPPWQITAFEVLDPETEIDFSNKTIADDHTGEDHDDHAGHDHP